MHTLQVYALFLAGFAMLALELRQLLLRSRIPGWRLTEAVIEQSGVVEDDEGPEPRIRYRYTIGGQVYTGDALFPDGFSVGASRRWAEDIVHRFPTGGRAWVFVDPADPSNSTLGMPLPLWVHLLLWCFGIGCLIAAVALARNG